MKKLFAVLFLPIRLIFLGFRSISLGLSRGDHLYLKIPGKFSDSQKSFFLRKIQGEEVSPFLVEYLEFLAMLKKDKRVKNISLEIPKLYMGFSEFYSIYRELIKLRESGISIIGYSEEGDIKNLILLSLCDKKYSSEAGEFHILLPSVDAMFFGEVVKNWDVKIDVFQSGAYKSFGEIFTRKEFSKEARSNLESLINDHKVEMISLFGENSRLTEDLLQKPILHSSNLRDLSFLNGLLNLEQFRSNHNQENPEEYSKDWELIESNKDNDKDKKEFLKAHKPLSKPLSENSVLLKEKVRGFRILGDNRPSIAVLPMKGQIVSGKPEETEPKSGLIEGNSIVNVLQELKNNHRIQAVILEIDSPGGSASESEKIFQAIKNLDKVKPVYAYMSNTCASGGYYIACAARKIYSSPHSTVGSIGSIMMRFNLDGLYSKLGITKDKIGFYPLREIYSDTGKLTKESVRFLKQEIKRVESLFRKRVEESRKISSSVLNPMAGGRVFNARKFTNTNLSDGIASILEVADNLSKLELNGKSVRLIYQAPRYNVKLALKNLSPIGNFQFKNSIPSSIQNGIDNLIHLEKYANNEIQHLWLGGIQWMD